MEIPNPTPELLKKYLKGTLTESESAQFDTWLQASPENRAMVERLQDPEALGNEIQQLYQYNEEKAWQRLQQQLHIEPESRKTVPFVKKWKPLMLAASVAAIFAMGYWMIQIKADKTMPSAASELLAEQEIAAPQKAKAVLLTGTGSQIQLDTARQGLLAQQGNVLIHLNSQGEIVYNGNGSHAEQQLVNPRGGTVITLRLEDGTKVWLNSASSIHFPASFTANERRIRVTGEAFLEVAKDAKRPFKVSTPHLNTEVLGTSFNISAYSDEPQSSVTLVEGKLRVLQQQESVVLAPGEQAITSTQLNGMRQQQADLDHVLAWKQGVFLFEDDDLASIFRTIARWYDLDLHFQGGVPKEKFSGLFSRELTLNEILHILQSAGFNYRIENKKLTIIHS